MARTRKTKSPAGRDFMGRREGYQSQCAGTGWWPKRITHRKERQRDKRISATEDQHDDTIERTTR